MKVGQSGDITVTAVNPDGSQAIIPPGTLATSLDGGAVTLAAVSDGVVKATGASPGVANITFSAPGFKPAVLQIIVEDMPQIMATLGTVA